MSKRLLPAVVVLNAKYYSDGTFPAAKVGATSFTLSVLRVLRDAGVFAGLILYKRREEIRTPSIAFETRNSIACAVLSFNFDMLRTDVQGAIADAAQQLTVRAGWSNGLSLLYYQTDTLLMYQPEWLPYCVTHHGPFYKDFTNKFSAEHAAVAFGSSEKARLMERQQESGLQHLLGTLRNGFILQHSQLQRDYLLRCGIDPSRIRRLSPPIEPQAIPGENFETHMGTFNIAEFIAAATRERRLLLITTVARLDYFKNIEILIDAGVELLGRGVPIKVLIAGGDFGDDSGRKELLDRVPASYTDDFRVVPKLGRKALYSLFDCVRHIGIFVCPSRYETLGITPLEAALSGVTTVISDSANVEASRYFPAENLFSPSATGLASLIERYPAQRLAGCGSELCQRVAKLVKAEQFGDDLIHAWGDFSETVLQEQSQRIDNDINFIQFQALTGRKIAPVAGLEPVLEKVLLSGPLAV